MNLPVAIVARVISNKKAKGTPLFILVSSLLNILSHGLMKTNTLFLASFCNR